MVRINRVTTKTGDKGQTRLAGGQAISKDAPRLEAYGGVEELNAHLGVLVSHMVDHKQLADLTKQILRIQNELFSLGTMLAVLPNDRRTDTPAITRRDVERLETEITVLNQSLPALASFVLPGGGRVGAYFHLARTVCRRVERCVVHLASKEEIDDLVIPYLNRLSDWLFVAGRWAVHQLDEQELLWKP